MALLRSEIVGGGLYKESRVLNAFLNNSPPLPNKSAPVIWSQSAK